jgi:hypothetical protein
VLLEGDSLNVIVDLTKGPCGGGCGQLISNTKLILSRLGHYNFHHVKRNANRVAHYTTKFVFSQLLNKV